MTTSITITKPKQPAVAPTRRALPGGLWFIALWCAGVSGAMSLGFAFRILMNLTIFAVK
jgi:hypothetical protein